MDSRQSVCTTIPTFQFLSLSKEVKKNGKGAINNRINSAARLRTSGHIKAAERAEKDAEVMIAIAERDGLEL